MKHDETKNNRLRPWWMTTEWAVFAVLWMCINEHLSQRYLLICLTLLVSGYIFSRGYYKQHRGLFYSGLWTSELYVLLLAGIGLWINVRLNKVVVEEAWISVTIMAVFYFQSRAMVKSLGTKTQLVIR